MRPGYPGALSKLDRYEAKRDAAESPEPFTGHTAGGTRFVVQKHAARRLHYDLRLEHDGVLMSWAVPQGPSLDPKIKRLAVRTEDHPVDYADFEGIIPPGNYGAGSMIVWDQGRFDAVEDITSGLDRGKLLFELHGHKLRGRWTLVRTRRKNARSEEWLLIKKPDGWARTGDEDQLPEMSVLSGLTVEELPHRRERLERLVDGVAEAPTGPVRAEGLEVMLAETVETPFDGDDWWFELKYDGFRLIAGKDGSDISLRYRRGKEVNGVFPDLVAALKRLPCERVVLDGEVVVLDDEAVPRFQLLQRRVQLRRPADLLQASLRRPATYYAFDILGFGDKDLRGLPLRRRKELLEQIVPRLGPVRFADHVPAQGVAFFAEVEKRQLEGLVAKRAEAPYRAGRSRDWLKIPCRRRDDFAIVGYTRPKGDRAGFGGLHLAAGVEGELIYAGRVGSGFRDADLRDLAAVLAAAERPTPPLEPPTALPSGTRWVEPELVCEVRYLARTEEGLLRQPVFLGLRPDKSVDDVRGEPPAPPPAPPKPTPEEAPRVVIVNPDKVFFPESGRTKMDLVRYYRAVAPALLPLLDDRPAVLTRYPDGIEGKSFFQKNMPPHTPAWVRRQTVWSEHAEREIGYLILDSVDALDYAINSASIPLHVWASRTRTLRNPDWLVLDLDPKGAPFTDVVTLARSAHRLCEDVGLPSFCKTSGQAGLHVLVPLGRQLEFGPARQLAELFARVLVDRHPEIATIDRMISARKGRVYIDYVQNGHGRLLVSAFSVRPLPRGPVSTPLHWREVKASLDPSAFDIVTVPKRLARQRKDPWAGLLDAEPDLAGALSALGPMLSEQS